MKTPAKGTKVTYKGKEYTFNGTDWETKIGGNIAIVPAKDDLNKSLEAEALKPKPSPAPGGGDLDAEIKKAVNGIDQKLALINNLIAVANKNNELKVVKNLEDAKNDLEAFKTKASNPDNWRGKRYEEGSGYIMKSGGIGGVEPDAYVKQVVEKIDYKRDDSPYKKIVIDYQQKEMPTESTQGGLQSTKPTIPGVNQGDEKTYKEGDKYDVNGTIYTYRKDGGDSKNYRWYSGSNKTGEFKVLDTGDMSPEEYMDLVLKNGFAQPIETFKYQGVNYRYNPNDGKWYGERNKEAASEGITERINTLREVEGKAPLGKDRTAEEIKTGGEFRLGLQDKTKTTTPLAKTDSKTKSLGIGVGKPMFESQTPEGDKTKYTTTSTTTTGGTPLANTQTSTTTPLVNTREKQTEIPLKPSLQRTETPLAGQSELFDRGSAEAMMRGEAGKDLGFLGRTFGGMSGKLGGLAEYLPDVFKATLGLAGANKELPEFEVPSYFTDYQRRMQELSQQGLTAEELGTANRGAERAYAYDVNNIERFSGGRPGVALSNLGRATTSYQDALGNINLADAQMRRQNLSQYGGIVNTRLGLDKDIFNTKYNEAMQSKMAGAQLAADALSNIDERQQYNKFYGDDSTYGKYMQSLQEGQNYQNSIYQYQLQNPGTIPTFNPGVISKDANITPQAYQIAGFYDKYGGMNLNTEIPGF